ncbi:MAG: shikimate dehydrogenase [Prevotellaceae bacterium]|jgi:shikimate dehydrogenase|nr:shikimate dehydrogenase [Prevotellaceae bacterium]
MKTYGLIGYPLQHSFSEGYFNEKFRSENIDAQYINFEIPTIDELKRIIASVSLSGLNVTLPYKEQVIPYLDELDAEAAAIGSVNVIKFTQKKSKPWLIGYNSDATGFTQSIEPLLQPHHREALVLGTGGSAKAIAYGLKSLGIRAVFVSRTPRKGQLAYTHLTPAVMETFTVIVNCTPVGMFPHVDTCPDIPYELLTERHLLYDLLYNPNETLFMQRGAAQGATVKNGLEMLLLQGFTAWEIWNK